MLCFCKLSEQEKKRRRRRRGGVEEEKERQIKGETNRDRGKGGFPRLTSFSPPLEVELVLIWGHVLLRPE